MTSFGNAQITNNSSGRTKSRVGVLREKMVPYHHRKNDNIVAPFPTAMLSQAMVWGGSPQQVHEDANVAPIVKTKCECAQVGPIPGGEPA